MDSLLYLSAAEVAAGGPTMAECIGALEVAFREKGEGRVEMAPKPGIHPGGEDNFIHAMPAYIPALRSAGLKWVSGFPGNANRGATYIAGLLVFNDVETGLPLAVMDGGWITAMRTGAASAVAAQYRHVTRQPSNGRRLSLQRDAGLNSAAPVGGSTHAGAIFPQASSA